MFRGPHFIVSTMQAGTTPIFNVFGMTGPSSNRESNPQILLVSAGSPLSSPFTISRGYWGPIRYQGAPSRAPTPDPHGEHCTDNQPLTPEPIPGTYDPSCGVAYYFFPSEEQVRRLPKYLLKGKKLSKTYDNTPEEPSLKGFPLVGEGGYSFMFLWFCPVHCNAMAFI